MKISDTPCVVEGCDRLDVQGQGLCQMHYYRQRRQGTPGEADRRQREAVAVCSVEGCDTVDCGPHGMCWTHRARVQRHGDPSVVLPRKGMPLDQHPAWLPFGHETYNAVHHRVRAERGSASTYQCVRCDRRAKHWAYDHTDPDERQSDQGPFSGDLNHYQPMCVPCHKRMDLARLAGE